MEAIIWLAVVIYFSWRLRHLLDGRTKSGR